MVGAGRGCEGIMADLDTSSVSHEQHIGRRPSHVISFCLGVIGCCGLLHQYPPIMVGCLCWDRLASYLRVRAKTQRSCPRTLELRHEEPYRAITPRW